MVEIISTKPPNISTNLVEMISTIYQIWRMSSANLPIYQIYLAAGLRVGGFRLVLTGPNLPIYQIWRTSSANLPIYQIYLASAWLLRPFTVKPNGNLADAPKTGVGRFTKPSLPTLNLPR